MMKKKMNGIGVIGWAAAFLLMVQAGPLYAHKVIVFAWVDGNTIHSESKFHGGRPAKEAPVEVVDLNGEKLLEGKTDEKGAFSFTIPKKTAMKIVLKAGMGHQGEWTVPLEDLVGQDTGSHQKTATGEKAAPDVAPPSPARVGLSSLPSERVDCLTREEVSAIVEEALDKKMAFMNETLNRLLDPQKDPSLSEIMGGIGYILGLVGLAAYFQARKEKR